MDISSESEKCQLYTRAAQNIMQKRNQFKAKLEDFENIINIESEETLNDGSSETLMDIALQEPEPNNQPNNDEQITNRMQTRSTRRGRPLKAQQNEAEPRKRPKKRKSNTSKRRRPNCNSDISLCDSITEIGLPVVTNQEPLNRPIHNDNVVVLDDDSDFANLTFNPIEFNGCKSTGTSRKSTPLDNDCSIISLTDEVSDEEDEPVVISIEWNNGRLVSRKQFELRKYQKFENIFDQLANIEGVPTSRISLMRDSKCVKPGDTPDSLNLKYYAGLTGSISANNINYDTLLSGSDTGTATNNSVNNSIITVKLKLESQKTLNLSIMKHQKMNVLYKKCSEELKCNDSDIKLTFDGDYIDPKESVLSLDIEDGDIFNVYFKKPIKNQ